MRSIDAKKLQQMIIGAYEYLNENKDKVNELNVFPVPDGDTGTNMTMTIKSGVDKVNKTSLSSVDEVAKALSQGTLMGARGNSGVILSQLVRGMSKSLKGKDEIEIEDMKNIFENAKVTAYKAVMQPTEGTILTVARKMAEKASLSIDDDISLDQYLLDIIADGQIALDNTPNQLPVLKEAGVVDSGGAGLIYLLRGALNALNSDIDKDIDLSTSNVEKEDLKYELKINVKGSKDNLDALLDNISNKSFEVQTQREENSLSIDLKTDYPKQIVELAMLDTTLINVSITNLKASEEFVEDKVKTPSKKYGFIAVSRGSGYNDILKSMNVDKIIEGGQTMNPSTEDFFKAIEEVDSENIIIFPNNKNIILSANQASEVSEKNVFVVETKSIPESFSALLEFDENEAVEDNIENMNEVLEEIHLGEVSISIRDTKVKGVDIRKDEYLAILDGEIISSEKNIEKAVAKICEKAIQEEDISLITLYYGEDVDKKKAKDLSKSISKKNKDVDVELVFGGQPVYYYTITLE